MYSQDSQCKSTFRCIYLHLAAVDKILVWDLCGIFNGSYRSADHFICHLCTVPSCNNLWRRTLFPLTAAACKGVGNTPVKINSIITTYVQSTDWSKIKSKDQRILITILWRASLYMDIWTPATGIIILKQNLLVV